MAYLKRSRNAILGGVCGGIAEWLGWDATVVRILYVLISIFSAAFPGNRVCDSMDCDAESLIQKG